MEPILKTAVLILMGANAAGADLGIACENWSEILLGIDREGGGRSRLPLSQARIGGGGEGGERGRGRQRRQGYTAAPRPRWGRSLAHK
jgi:hypothetical protein